MRARLLAASLIVLAAAPAAAQQAEGDPEAGHELASQLCTACHIVGNERAGTDMAPPFAAIAKDPNVTLSELHGWGGAGHPMLPNLVLTPKQVADINAYLDTLRDGGGEARPSAEEPQPALGPAPPERLGKPITPSD
jgi:mono/diheme cytochrome c family protein